MDNNKKDHLRSIAILYLLLAIDDEDFQIIEAEEIVTKLKEWMADIKEDDLKAIIYEAQKLIAEQDHIKLFNNSAEFINKVFDENNKINVLRDLIDIALVDGELKKEEYNIITILAELWDVQDKIDIVEYIKEVTKGNMSKNSNDILKDEGFIDEKTENMILRDKYPSDWSIIHDILALVIYTGSQANNNITDLEWEIIYSNISKFNLDINNRIYTMSNYKMEEIAELVDVVMEQMWGEENAPQDPSVCFQASLKNLIDYYTNRDLDKKNIYNIINLMFDVSIADDFITDSQKYILEYMINTFIPSIPALEKFTDMIEIQITKQKLKRDLASESNISNFGGSKINNRTGKMEFTLSELNESKNNIVNEEIDIIAEVFKVENTYRARKKGTDEDITDIINNTAKLKYAYERSGLIRGKKDKTGNYIWRVMG